MIYVIKFAHDTINILSKYTYKQVFSNFMFIGNLKLLQTRKYFDFYPYQILLDEFCVVKF